MSELDTVREYEENNYAWAKDRLGTATELIQGLVDLYDVMADLARSGPAKLGPEDLMSVALLLTCRYELGMAGLDILRTHRLASYQHTRRAIETCAFARRIKNDPALITLWSNAGDDELAYDAYRKQFRSVQTFPKSHKLLSVLYEHYELCSRRSHPSVLSVGLQTTIAKTGETTTIEVGYFQLDPEDKIEPLITLLWTVDTHLTILRVFEEDVLPSFIANDPPRWTIRRNAVDTSFQIQVSRVKALRSEAEAAKIPLIWFPS